ncbi:hypothetical protein V8E36_006331 [Tilletia maclaganii]
MVIFSTLRGKRGGRRESFFGSSTTADEYQHSSKAKSASSTSAPYNRDATDVLGEAPSFSSRNRTPSESASLRNRTSSSNMLRLFGSNKRSTSTTGHEIPSNVAGSSSISDVGHRSSHATVRPGVSSPTPLSVNGDAAPAGPRPSDLFAGKGIDWDQVKLSGTSAAPTDAKRNDELQNYLKARRQWIPTFKTDDNGANDADKVTTKLEDVSFGGAPAAPSELMTLKDLEASHNRKQKLLSDLPISSLATGRTSTSISEGASKPPLTSRPSQTEVPVRNQSFRQSTFIGASSSSTPANLTSSAANRSGPVTTSGNGPSAPIRKPAPSAPGLLDAVKRNGNGHGNAAASSNGTSAATNGAATASASAGGVAAPPRKSSVALGTGETLASNGPAATPSSTTQAAPPQTAGSLSASSAGVRPSLDSTAGFATPEARSEAAHAGASPAGGDQTPKVA